ncbi:MAG: formylglycine-generating enzyme family protein [Planctomycetes bacterium]|nr:formylglycine-generating enzyme family protein [Planctomycetota bacterium]
MRRAPLALLLPALAVLAACGGSGGSLPVPAAGGAASGVLVDRGRAQWQVLDLASGQTVLAAAALPDLAANPAYRDRLMVFRLVPGGVAALGGGTRARQADELPASAAVEPFYLGAFEVTRSQWLHLAGSAPWLAAEVAPAAADDPALPATGLSPALAAAGLARWNAAHGPQLHLPQPAQWEHAARAGSTGTWPWGEDGRAGAVRAFAVTWEAQLGEAAPGPRPVGGRLANAWGLHDCCGNAWELVADGSARGGSWADATSLARPANRLVLDPDEAGAAVGVRLLYRP